MLYCIYTLDENGHVTNRLVVRCPNDEVAKQCAKRFIDRQDIELGRVIGSSRLSKPRLKAESP